MRPAKADEEFKWDFMRKAICGFHIAKKMEKEQTHYSGKEGTHDICQRFYIKSTQIT